MRRIFDYDDYRRLLRDYFAEQKRTRAHFSHRYFAQRAGFRSSGFCAHVMGGQRNLKADSVAKLIKGLGLSGREADYFAALVRCCQSASPREKEEWRATLDRLRRHFPAHRLERRQYAYYGEWYFPVIRELAAEANWGGDYARLGKLVRPALPPDKARKAVETLLAIGLLERAPGGRLVQAQSVVSAAGVPRTVTRACRRDLWTLGMEAAEALGPGERHASAALAGLGEASFREFSAELDRLRARILERAVAEKASERVYHFHFLAFPVSERLPLAGPRGKSRGAG